MLKIVILTIGKDKDRWITEGINHYRKLLSKYTRIEFQILPEIKGASSLPPAEVKKRQAALFRKKLGKGMLIALSDSGRQSDSHGFARLLERVQISAGGQVTFLIGGAFGLDEKLLKEADRVVSLSRLTFSHQLCRLVLLEQLYRGYDILHGGSYHK